MNNNNNNDSSTLETNFVATQPASEYAEMYKKDKLTGGHVIMLGPGNKEAAEMALNSWPTAAAGAAAVNDNGNEPEGFQIGGGMNADNCREWLDKGAAKIIVTSYIFTNSNIDFDKLRKLVKAVGGKERLVLDLSCRKKKKETSNNNNSDDNNDLYYVVTNKWQTFTDTALTPEMMKELSQYCSEFLVHGVDVEGLQCGILPDLVSFLGQHSPIPVTYAGGVRSLDDLDRVHEYGQGKVDVTVGSALDIFGGSLPYKDVVQWHQKHN